MLGVYIAVAVGSAGVASADRKVDPELLILQRYVIAISLTELSWTDRPLASLVGAACSAVFPDGGRVSRRWSVTPVA